MPRTILFDTSAWLALAVPSDTNHARAVVEYDRLRSASRYVSTWGVISETYTWLLYHAGRRYAGRFLNEVEDLVNRKLLRIVYPTASTDANARRELTRFDDQRLSYIDAVNLSVARSEPDIDAIFAFDHHMHLAGLPVLPL